MEADFDHRVDQEVPVNVLSGSRSVRWHVFSTVGESSGGRRLYEGRHCSGKERRDSTHSDGLLYVAAGFPKRRLC